MPKGVTPFRRRLLIPAILTLGVIGVLSVPGSGTPAASPGRAAAIQATPNVVVIETDDQTAASMRVMHNVNALIGDQGARFKNSFVNFSLCCPSRATFLTGQYAHNHRVIGNMAPNGGFHRFESLHGNNNLAVWLQDAGYYTAMIGKYLNGYANDPRSRPAGRSGTRPLRTTRTSTTTRSTRTAPWSTTARSRPTSSRTC